MRIDFLDNPFLIKIIEKKHVNLSSFNQNAELGTIEEILLTGSLVAPDVKIRTKRKK